MKRFIFGLAVVLCAAASAAFTTPQNSPSTLLDHYFAFDYGAPYLPTIENVQDPAKWVEVGNMTGCSSGSNRACKLRVADTYVSGGELISSFNIEAEETDDDVARVADSDASQIVNRANP